MGISTPNESEVPTTSQRKGVLKTIVGIPDAVFNEIERAVTSLIRTTMADQLLPDTRKLELAKMAEDPRVVSRRDARRE